MGVARGERRAAARGVLDTHLTFLRARAKWSCTTKGTRYDARMDRESMIFNQA